MALLFAYDKHSKGGLHQYETPLARDDLSTRKSNVSFQVNALPRLGLMEGVTTNPTSPVSMENGEVTEFGRKEALRAAILPYGLFRHGAQPRWTPTADGRNGVTAT